MSSTLMYLLATVTPFVLRHKSGGTLHRGAASPLPNQLPPPLPREWLDKFAELASEPRVGTSTFSGPPTMPESPRKTSPAAPLSDIDAVALYLDAWLEEIGESFEDLGSLVTDYKRFRKSSEIVLPIISEKRFSQCLVSLGCRRLKRDGRRKGEDGKRATVIELRRSKKGKLQ